MEGEGEENPKLIYATRITKNKRKSGSNVTVNYVHGVH